MGRGRGKKDSEEELLKKDYQPAPKWVVEIPFSRSVTSLISRWPKFLRSPEAKGEEVPIQDVDMKREKPKQDSRGETKKKRLSIVRPPPLGKQLIPPTPLKGKDSELCLYVRNMKNRMGNRMSMVPSFYDQYFLSKSHFYGSLSW